MLVRHAKEVAKLGYQGHVRQIAALSSFHIPDKPISHPNWRIRSPA